MASISRCGRLLSPCSGAGPSNRSSNTSMSDATACAAASIVSWGLSLFMRRKNYLRGTGPAVSGNHTETQGWIDFHALAVPVAAGVDPPRQTQPRQPLYFLLGAGRCAGAEAGVVVRVQSWPPHRKPSTQPSTLIVLSFLSHMRDV